MTARTWGLRKRIYAVFLATMAAFVALSIAQNAWFKQVADSYDHIAKVNLHKADHLALMRSYAKDVALSVALIAAPDNPAAEHDRLRKKFADYLKKYDDVKADYLRFPVESDDETKLWEQTDERWKDFVASASQSEKLAGTGDNDSRTQARAMLRDGLSVRNAYYSAIERLMDYQAERGRAWVTKAESDRQSQMSWSFWMIVLSVVAGCAVTFVIVQGLLRSITGVVDQLNSEARGVGQAAAQVSELSQELSSTSTEQASAIEETSASLTELSEMVENNVKNSENSASLADNVCEVSEEGDKSMRELIQSMNEILESNRKIEKLVELIGEIGEKTEVIDEIVFQTKLLSFNASVEAERAGEHGRGFAVVAQEVANLAQMSGKAALEISGILKEGLKSAEQITHENRRKVEQGNELVSSTAEMLGQVRTKAQKMATSARQILEASKEQATGIKQISSAMEGLSGATQNTARTATESAVAGEQLMQQSENLDHIIHDLGTIVMGSELRFAQTAYREPSHPVRAPYASRGRRGNVVGFRDRAARPAAPAPVYEERQEEYESETEAG